MTLVDDARRLMSEGAERYDAESERWECPFCPGRFDHNPDCPWLSMARIVAALEAAQAVVDDYKPQYRWAGVMLRLDAALRGEEARSA